MTSPFYITTPIYYVNAKPHLGHAYTTVAADAACRFHLMLGQETYFLTGTDEHGDKIVKAAEKENITPADYAERISRLFRDLWPHYHIANNQFIRTTDPAHKAVVSSVLQRIFDAGDIYFSEYEGLYCFGCERFYTERELVDGKCPDHEVAPAVIKESNYFFKMSRYQDWLIQHIQEHPDFIQPERYRNETLAFLRDPLEDLCISRPKSRLEWGIPLPFDDNYVTYVWFDALINYLSALGYPDGDLFGKFWPAARHVVAKDILKPHAIYWPIILKAAGIPPYQRLYVHGYWNIDDTKMSKSLGNVVDPYYLHAEYGADPVRYFFLREMAFGLDAGFSESLMVERINADLANDLGNLFSRVLAMVHKYFGGTAPAANGDGEPDENGDIHAAAIQAVDEFAAEMAAFAFHKALQSVWNFVSILNKYVVTSAPWTLAKSSDPAHRARLARVMVNLLEGLRVIAYLMTPIMPEKARMMRRRLGISDADAPPLLNQARQWGTIAPGTLIPAPVTLFPRIEPPKTETNPAAPPKPALPLKPEITFDDVAKLDLRVGTVLCAEAIPKANKLLKLTVDLGAEQRIIVAGIAKSYKPEDMTGKQIVVVANLKPAKLMGVQSQGMLLAAVSEERSVVVGPSGNGIPAGSVVR